ncbi:hypothetical protein [Pedobacter steynii]
MPGVTDAVIKNAIYEALNGKSGWTDGIFRLYSTIAQDFLYKNADQNVVFLDNHDMSRFYSMIGEDPNKFKTGNVYFINNARNTSNLLWYRNSYEKFFES